MRTIAAYAAARLLPAGLQFLVLLLLTRNLVAAEYGHYAALQASASLIGAVVLQWLSKATLRFSGNAGGDGKRVLADIGFAYSACCLLLLLGGFALAMLGVVSIVDAAATITMAIALSSREISQEHLRIKFAVKSFAVRSLIDAMLTLAVTAAMLRLTSDAPQLILAASLGTLLVFFPSLAPSILAGFRAPPDLPRLREYFSYGYPVSLTTIVSHALYSGSRLFIGYLLGVSAMGVFSAAYDLVQRTLVVLMSILNLALYPRIQKSWDAGQQDKAIRLVGHNRLLQLAVGCSFAAFLACFETELLPLVFSKMDAQYTSGLFSLLAVAVFLNRIRAFHYELPFHLTRKTGRIFLSHLFMAAVGIGAMWALAPLGILGVAFALVLAYSLGIFTAPKIVPAEARGMLRAPASPWEAAIPLATTACAILALGFASQLSLLGRLAIYACILAYVSIVVAKGVGLFDRRSPNAGANGNHESGRK